MNPNPEGSESNTKARPPGNRFFQALGLFALAGGAAVLAYVVSISNYRADGQETVLLGQSELAADSPAAIRVVVRDRDSHKPVKDATVQLSLQASQRPRVDLGTFRTGPNGTIEEAIQIPDLPSGEYEFQLGASSRLGVDHISRQVKLQRPARLLLNSDKPLYQPSQTIHLRTLVNNSRTQKPMAGETVTFEVSDPKGNKVFKETRKASAFGIASADFELADELNLGPYEIRAAAGGVTATRTVEIKRYVLPKFKVRIATDNTYYLPGQTVSGVVEANYFFGKPAADAAVKLTAATYHEKPVVIQELSGQADALGKYKFQFKLPDFLAGRSQTKEREFLDLSAEVRDAGEHVEQGKLSLAVGGSDLELTAVPEAGVLVPGVENLLYVLASYPDGRPAPCTVYFNGAAHASDEQGVCALKLTPGEPSGVLQFQARDAQGHAASSSFSTANSEAAPPLLLRPDKAVYKAGEAVKLSLLSPKQRGTIFIDVLHSGQTVLTDSISLENNSAEHVLTLPPSLSGTLGINAYFLTESGEDRGCSRMVFVNPASALNIKAELAKPVFRPGEVAKLDFQVTDASGQPAPSALGISAVDESVFALAENRPGLLQQLMSEEREHLKSRDQSKSIPMPASFLSGPKINQGMAQAWLASLGRPTTGPALEEFVKEDLISPKLLEQVRRLKGTPTYEWLRANPDFADAIRLVEGGAGDYGLREATGAAKIWAAEAWRQAHFDVLKRDLFIGLGVLMVVLPIGLVIYYSAFYRPSSGTHLGRILLNSGEHRSYLSVAVGCHHLLVALNFLPLLLYPIGFIFIESMRGDPPGWILISIEAIVVVPAILFQIVRLSGIPTGALREELRPVKSLALVFLAQFIISRGGWTSMLWNPNRTEEGFAIFWLVASIVAPLVVLGVLDFELRQQMRARRVIGRPTHLTAFEAALVVAICALLAGMLLPALARAKSKSQRASLINNLKQIGLASRTWSSNEEAAGPGANGSGAVRVRRDFPETLFWRPQFITDDQGRASLEILLADSITTWRASVDAVNLAGKMGEVEIPIPVFQDFFVDLDLPVSLSLGDEITVPVICHNYLKEPQDIRVQLTRAPWFETTATNISVRLAPNEVRRASFRIKAVGVGRQPLRVTAQGAKIADAIEREVRVLPTGLPIEYTRNDSLTGEFRDTFTLPADAIPASANLWLKLYPSRFTEVVEGLESVFQTPHGCFEQTSSTTYPNVLTLDYLKQMGRLQPQVESSARGYINAGYQRLLTFEVPGGGFEWFGHSPAHVGLTAYGVLEFTDMKKVHAVDEAMLERTLNWLRSQQKPDGSWSQSGGLHSWQGSTTAYVAWALAEAGDRSANLDRALSFLRSNPSELGSTYDKALAANAFLARDSREPFGRQLTAQLKSVAIRDERKCVHWKSEGGSITGSRGRGLAVETTALTALALMKSGDWPEGVRGALTWISRQKMPNGAWDSTQATVLAMRALLRGSTTSLGQQMESRVTVLINDKEVGTFRINAENSDVLRQLNLTPHLQTGENRVVLRQTPAGDLPFQLTGAYWLPVSGGFTAIPSNQAATPKGLQIDAHYDRTRMAVDAEVKCAVTISNHCGRRIDMAIVDLGIPPGFEADTSAFDALREAGKISKCEATGNRLVLYLREIPEREPIQFAYALRAKYPSRVQSPSAVVYEYYEPANRAGSKPVLIEVN